ncbi:MAG: hypothetical protein QOE87_4402 [Gaiellales bacterium]|nr:hypothetical protein [Gaiellales bacterium]
MRRADVIAIALAVAGGVLGYSAGTGPLAGGIAALIVAGIAVRARSAHYIVVWAVAPLLFWATYPDPSGSLAAVALGGSATCALLGARDRPGGASDGVIAVRVTLAAAMVLTASGLLSFDLLLR